MRLPELTGHKYLDLLGEDPFGWSFISSFEESDHRLVRVLKSQATNDEFVRQYLELFSNGAALPEGVAEISSFQAGADDMPIAYSTPFYGWRSKESGAWQQTSLKRLMHLFQGEQAAEVVEEVATSIATLHEAGMFHGGLRPSSIYIAGDAGGSRKIAIGDFGQVFMGGLQFLEAGEPLFYASPEQLETGDFSSDLGYKWDVYAFGVIAFQMLTGHLPRLDRLRQQVEQNPGALHSIPAISYGTLSGLTEQFLKQLESEKPVEWPDAAPDRRSKRLREIIQNCLWFDPDRRTSSMQEVAIELTEILRAPTVVPVEPEPAAAERITESDVAPKPITEKIPVAPAETVAATELKSDILESAPASPSKPKFGRSRKAKSKQKASSVAPIAKAANVREKIVTGFRDRPQLKWQIAATTAAAALLPLSFLTLFYYLQTREIESELTEETQELQANVEKQALTYRKELKAKQRTSEQMRSELNDIADSNSRLLGEAKLARQLLRQTQDNGDELFRLVLENRDTDVPGFREERAGALNEAQKHYERLIEVYGDAPDFIVSTANAFFYLGRIYRELGEFGKSLASFGEAERRYMALLDDSDDPNPEFVKNLAISKVSLGDLSLKNSKFAIARHYYTESSRYWAEVRSLSPSHALESAINIQENSLAIVECELAINRLEPALDGARSIGAGLLKLQEQDPENEKILGALAKSFELIGRILEAQGEGDLAIEAHEQASNLYAKAVKLNAAIDAYQLGLGNSLARVGLLENDIKKLEGAVDILSEVVTSNPYESTFQTTLADVFGVLARNQRDGGHAQNAIELEKEAISILQPLIRKNPAAAPNALLYSYSERLAHLAELLGDAGEFDDSRAPLGESIQVLEKICKSEGVLAEHRRALARSRGLAGFACLKSGDNSEAKQHLEIAKAQWETFMAENPDDSDAEQAVRWTNDQLRRLQ